MNEWPVDILRKDLIAHGGTTSGQRSGSIKAASLSSFRNVYGHSLSTEDMGTSVCNQIGHA